MKRALLADTHFGIKKSNQVFLDSQLKFFENQFFPYLKEHNIIDIDILGDLWDTRVSINVSLENQIFEFFEKHKDFNFRIIVGNHDIYLNSSIKINSLRWLDKFDNIEIVDSIRERLVGGKSILYCPWVIDEKDFENYLITQNKKYDCVMGHFHLNGFKFDQMNEAKDGLQASIFNNYTNKVYSGHFHRPSITKIGNTEINYIGCPYELTRSNRNESHGFYILDTDTMTEEFIENTQSMKFKEINYPDIVDEGFVRGNVIDLYIQYKKDEDVDDKQLQGYLKRLEGFGPSYPVNTKIFNEDVIADIDGIDLTKVKSTADLISEYIGSTEIENKEEIQEIMMGLYNECKKEV